MPIVGTAGHVDHGKSTIVRALTGTDPDRWAEEKERGLTIDLGFAWTDLDGIDVGFVDVPGHERFIKNMLAGVGAVDCSLFVVAADAGWMPQSEEHASVLDLLGIEHGVIALTRIDLVDEETVELATLEVIEEVEGTVLEGWPIVPISGVTGTGLEALRAAISSVLREATAAERGPFRMWVDRSFTVTGSGQVVTGTVMSGTARLEDHLEVLPGGQTMRVRGLHHHGESVTAVNRGDRAAVNGVGGPGDLERGSLLASPGTVSTTRRLIATLRPTRHFESIPDRGAFHLHLGTASLPVQLRRLGSSAMFLVTSEDEMPVVAGDRIIVRDAGRRAVVGGGRVIDPNPPPRPRPEAVAGIVEVLDRSPDDLAQALLEARGIASASELSRETFGGTPSGAVGTGDLVVSPAYARGLAGDLIARAAEFHARQPTRPGLAKGEVATILEVDTAVIEAVVAGSSELAETEGAIHLASFANTLTDEQEAEWGQTRESLESSFDVPRLSAIDLPAEVVHFLLRRGDLTRVEEDLAFTRNQADDIVERVAELEDGFTVSEFKEHFGMSRRQAVPTVEWLDSIGRTRRQGDGRVVRNRE